MFDEAKKLVCVLLTSTNLILDMLRGYPTEAYSTHLLPALLWSSLYQLYTKSPHNDSGLLKLTLFYNQYMAWQNSWLDEKKDDQILQRAGHAASKPRSNRKPFISVLRWLQATPTDWDLNAPDIVFVEVFIHDSRLWG